MEDYIRQFVHKFKEEAYSLLSQLEQELLELEADSTTKNHLDNIFRVMHTLKGTAGMYGFENIQNLTHHLETIYDLIREGSYPVNNEILELTLLSVDHIKNLLEDEQLQTHDNQTRQQYLLDSVLNLINAPQKKDTSAAALPKEATELYTTYYIILRLEQSLFDRGFSLVNIFRELAEYGTYAIVKNFESIHSKADEWGIYFATQHPVGVLGEVFIFLEDFVQWHALAKLNLLDQPDISGAINKAQNSEVSQLSILEMVEAKYRNHSETASATDAATTASSAQATNPTAATLKTERPTAKNTAGKTPETSPRSSAKNQTILPPAPTVGDDLDTDQRSIAERVERVIDKSRTAENSRISVSADKLDKLMHLVTELVTTQSQFSLAIQNNDLRALRDIYERNQKLTKQFRDNTLDIRLVPIGDILIRFKRLVRDLARQLGKKIELLTEGMDTELDKSMIDTLAEPLLHLIRNSIDHGIELPEERIAAGKTDQGTILITAYHSGSHVFITIRDDGAGLNEEKIHRKAVEKGLIPHDRKLSDKDIQDLIFQPGFSTAQIINEVSGRGVGMDIVRQRIAEIRGEVSVASEQGLHTTFTIKLQPTIAIIDTMLVVVADTFCLIPIADIEVCGQISTQELADSSNLQTINFNDTPTAYVDLQAKLCLTRQTPALKYKLVFINLQGKRIALLVDKIIGEHQAVLKPLSAEFQNQKLITSASTLGDGSLAFMLDMNVLMSDIENAHHQY